MNLMSSDSADSVWTTEVNELRNGVHVAQAIIPERLDDLPILVLNCSDEPCKINAETILADLALANCTEPTDNETLTMLAGEQSYAHLSNLLEGLETGVTEQQRAELMRTLREYADVFSTGELDLG